MDFFLNHKPLRGFFYIFVSKMNIYSYIARRLTVDSTTTRLCARVAIVIIALCMAIMVIAIAIASGFRDQISKKIYSFMGAVEISAINPLGVADVNTPILDDEFLAEFNALIAPQKLKPVVQGGGVLQNGYANIGVALRSVGDSALQRGEIAISATAATELGLRQGDNVDLIVMGAAPIRRSLTIKNTFESGMQDFERGIAFVSPETAREVSGIDSAYVSYYLVEQPVDMAPLEELCSEYSLRATPAEQQYAQIFDWLSMIDQNMVLVLVIMVIVAIIGIVSAALIVILDAANTIATLRAIGMRSAGVQRIFFVYMARIVIFGVIYGLAASLAICYGQQWFEIIELDSASYFVSVIPMYVDPLTLVCLTLGAVVVISASVAIPTAIISKMNIADSLKFS